LFDDSREHARRLSLAAKVSGNAQSQEPLLAQRRDSFGWKPAPLVDVGRRWHRRFPSQSLCRIREFFPNLVKSVHVRRHSAAQPNDHNF
jgi:hypothetical protein